MKPDRLFYTAAGAIFLVLTVIGFQHYIFGGKRVDGTSIDPSILVIPRPQRLPARTSFQQELYRDGLAVSARLRSSINRPRCLRHRQ